MFPRFIRCTMPGTGVATHQTHQDQEGLRRNVLPIVAHFRYGWLSTDCNSFTRNRIPIVRLRCCIRKNRVKQLLPICHFDLSCSSTWKFQRMTTVHSLFKACLRNGSVALPSSHRSVTAFYVIRWWNAYPWSLHYSKSKHMSLNPFSWV